MASGDTLLHLLPFAGEAPSSNYATFNLRNGHPVLSYDPSTDESMVWTSILPAGYAGGGLTVTIIWASSGTTNNVVWNAQIERLEDEGTDTDSDSFASAQAATGAVPGTSGALQYTDITFTSGAQMDSLAAGELFRIKITRDADNGSDNSTADAQLYGVRIRET